MCAKYVQYTYTDIWLVDPSPKIKVNKLKRKVILIVLSGSAALCIRLVLKRYYRLDQAVLPLHAVNLTIAILTFGDGFS